MNLVLDVKLFQLRDFAFEYLPEAEAYMEDTKSTTRPYEYWYQLHRAATRQSDMNTSGIKLASLHLLRAVAEYAIDKKSGFVCSQPVEGEFNDEDKKAYNSITPQEHHDCDVTKIREAIFVFNDVTGRRICFDFPSEAVGNIADSYVVTKQAKNKPEGRNQKRLRLLNTWYINLCQKHEHNNELITEEINRLTNKEIIKEVANLTPQDDKPIWEIQEAQRWIKGNGVNVWKFNKIPGGKSKQI